MITVGQITKPQGVRGEVKVRPMTDDSSRFCVLKTVNVGNVPMRIDNVRVNGADVFIKFDGCNDRNAAEKLRGKFICIDRAAAVPLDDGEFFIADLIGATLVGKSADMSNDIGKIVSVQSFGAADVFTVECFDGKTMTFAFVKALDAQYDELKHCLRVDADRLKEVAVYDED